MMKWSMVSEKTRASISIFISKPRILKWIFYCGFKKVFYKQLWTPQSPCEKRKWQQHEHLGSWKTLRVGKQYRKVIACFSHSLCVIAIPPTLISFPPTLPAMFLSPNITQNRAQNLHLSVYYSVELTLSSAESSFLLFFWGAKGEWKTVFQFQGWKTLQHTLSSRMKSMWRLHAWDLCFCLFESQRIELTPKNNRTKLYKLRKRFLNYWSKMGKLFRVVPSPSPFFPIIYQHSFLFKWRGDQLENVTIRLTQAT